MKVYEFGADTAPVILLLACYPYKWAQLVKSILEQGV